MSAEREVLPPLALPPFTAVHVRCLTRSLPHRPPPPVAMAINYLHPFPQLETRTGLSSTLLPAPSPVHLPSELLLLPLVLSRRLTGAEQKLRPRHRPVIVPIEFIIDRDFLFLHKMKSVLSFVCSISFN